ncbi:TetR family transcriptional regulator [Corynebacterium heidelbergense]|uniref:TetR family transcriptional regulator n=2 Tax=Corynebacterium heidelbergense TaxID=2055947 RepID=A0A364V3G6_9CORY|nr:TetR family transcriptional regulator [Corynebacterium heidelbergense]
MPRMSEENLASVRAEILRGARECFITYGYKDATVARLEASIGKSRGAIFHHFRNKDTLFLEVAHDDMARMTQAAREHGMIGMIRMVLHSPERAGWWAMRMEILRRVRTDPCFRAKWELDQLALQEVVTDRLRENAARGRIRSDVDVVSMYHLLDLVLEGVMAKLPAAAGTEDMQRALQLVELAMRQEPQL